ncbi:PE domain-containing protein [Pseudonocardiaceae bacterium YIM PH 21723]|nr:PE domain-containing protein [Pseudonocardiaceae bacterium YIM PH 21723]
MSGGSGFRVEDQTLVAAIDYWQRVEDQLKIAEKNVAPVYIKPSAGDPVSISVANKANSSVEAYKKHNKDMQEFARNYIRKLRDARKFYGDVERHSQESLSDLANFFTTDHDNA